MIDMKKPHDTADYGSELSVMFTCIKFFVGALAETVGSPSMAEAEHSDEDSAVRGVLHKKRSVAI